MPEIPRNLSGKELSSLLTRFGYLVIRQTGSHIRLRSVYRGDEHNITIPSHTNLKIGTLSNILHDIAIYLGKPKNELVNELF